MSETKWTKQQLDAINTRDKNILVSAAAGSGKTAVLTERIIELLKENKDIDITSMLILTFTKSAANEMKTRIQSKLHEYLITDIQNTHIKNQISLVGQAPISTMHSFCIDIIRENFQILDIDPNFSMGNESVIGILKDEAIEEIFEEKYEDENEDFLKLVDIYSKRNDDSNLIGIIYQIYSFIQSKKEPMVWLYNQAEKYKIQEDNIENNEYFKLLKQEISTKIQQTKIYIQNARKLSQKSDLVYTQTLDEDLKNIESLESCLTKSYDDFVKDISEFKMPRLKTLKKTENTDVETAELVKNIRTNYIKKYGFDELKKYNISSTTYLEQMNKFYPVILALCDIVKEFSIRYKQKKIENNLFDFNDLEHFTLDILDDENCRLKIKQKYKYIFYDEYQDSNEVQDTIIQKIASKNNLFFVGDVKQSIYRFRLAEPQIFIDKYEKYKTDVDSKKIDLSANFRSTKQIIDFCNKIFEKIMIKQISGIDYDDDARLKTLKEGQNEKRNIQINFITKSQYELSKDDDKNMDISELEDEEIMAEVTAKQILDMVNSNENIQFKDIVILKRSLRNSVSIYAKVFRKYKIPIFIDYSQAVFEVLEVGVFIDFLKIIDNIRQDEPLLSVLLSSIGNFNIDEITKIKIYDREEKYFHKIFFKYSHLEDELAEKIRKFIAKVEYYAQIERYMRLDHYIDFIMKDSHYKDYVQSMPQGDMRLANLEIINEKAREFIQNENKSLFYFLIYISSILKNKSDDATPKMISKEQNLVRFMSIHKSKGLEFGVVILNDLQKTFNKQDINREILLDSNYGIGANFIDEEKDYYTTTLAKKAVVMEYEKGARAEEIRILYVALTRAVDKLILNSIAKAGYTKMIENIQSGFFPKALDSINNYQDFILYAIQEDIRNYFKDTDLYEFNEIDAKEILNKKVENIDVKAMFEKKLGEISLSNEERDKIKEKYTNVYKYSQDIEKMIKNSVTSLSKQKNKYIIETMLNYKDINRNLDFSSAQIGTLNHLFLQNIDFSKKYSRDDLEEKLEELISLEFITRQESDVINLDKIYEFINSDFGKRIQSADKIYQEESFITSYDGGILTGIVDLFFEENGYIVLLDYKTDDVKEEFAKEHSQKYQEQINLYKQAISQAFSKPVKESYIYFLSINKQIRMD